MTIGGIQNPDKASEDTRSSRRELPYYVMASALGIPAILIGLQLSAWIGFFMFPSAIRGRADFRHLYTAGYMIRSGHVRELYDYDAEKKFQSALVSPGQIALPFNHPAYEALFFVPFSLLRYQVAYFAFMAVNIGLLVISFRLLWPCLGNLGNVWPLLPAGIFFGFFPVTIALMLGQDSILLLTFLALALLSLERGRELTAGLLVGIALFKFQIVVPIALFFLAWRRWRFSSGFALSALSVSLVSVLLVGFAQLHVYLKSLVSMSLSLASAADQFKYGISPTMMPNLRGLIFALANNHLPGFWVQAITIVVSLLVMLWVAAAPPFTRRESDALLLAITAATVVSYHLLIHDLTVLLIPIALTLNRFIESDALDTARGQWMLGVAALLLVAPSFVFLVSDHFYVTVLPLCAFLIVLRARPGPEQS